MIRKLLALGAGLVLADRATRALVRGGDEGFAGQVVLITGGSRGLGLVLARQLASAGARLALVARDEAELEVARADVGPRGGEVVTLVADLTDRAEAHRVVERVVEHYGRIDVLINNAGVIQSGPLEHMQAADFEQAMDIHFWAALATMQTAVPHMRRQGGGRIVNIASVGGRVAVPHLVPYCASKFALVGLSDGMRAELAADHISITTVCPGLMRTGSPFNALFKGQHRREFAWFSIADSLPLVTIAAEQAAAQILAACRHRDAHLTITVAARALVLADAILPNLMARAHAVVARLLPGPTDARGDVSRTGWQSRSELAPSVLTTLTNRAAQRNNETGSHTISG